MNNPNDINAERIKLLEEDLSQGKQKFKEKLYHLFSQEFEEKIPNILVLKETDFMYQYLNRIKLVIEDLYSNEAYDNFILVQLMKECEKKIYEEGYKKSYALLNKGWNEYENAINTPQKGDIKHFRKSSMENRSLNSLSKKSTIIYLKSYRKHCQSTDAPIHKCKGRFIPIFDDKREITHVICCDCKSCYFANSILMFCNACNVEYYSCHSTNLNKNYQPATWEKYHCGAIINDQMHCIKCKDLFYLNLVDGTLVCLKCKFEADPLTILWNCMLCHRDFKSNAKIYNPMEFKLIKVAIKNTILAKIPTKPQSVPCCNINVRSYTFFHKGECRGYLYQGEINGKKIIVCSKCKMMTNFEKFIWTCPVCLKRFKQKDLPQDGSITTRPSQDDCSYLKTEDNTNYRGREERNANTDINTEENEKHYRDMSKGRKSKNISFSVTRKSDNEDDEESNLDQQNYSSNSKNIKLTSSKRNFNIVNPVKRIEIDISRSNGGSSINPKNSSPDQRLGISTPSKKQEPVRGVSINLQKSGGNFFKVTQHNPRANENRVSNYNNYLINNPKASPVRTRATAYDDEEDDRITSREEARPGSSAQNFYKKSISMANYSKPIEIKFNTPNRPGVVAVNPSPSPRADKVTEFSVQDNGKEVEKNNIIYEKVSPNRNAGKKNEGEPKSENGSNGLINLVPTEEASIVTPIKQPVQPEVPTKLKEFNFEDYNVITQIGEGSFGKIYLVEDKQKNIYSMKKIIASDDIDLEAFQSEYELVNLVRHPNIMRILAMCKRKLDYTTHVLYILMEVGLTDWEKEIKSRQSLKQHYSEKELISVLKQLVSALAFLQSKNISHRDIKPQNVLIFKNNLFKVADFGEAKQISKMETNKQLSTLRGTELYMSPLLFNALRTNQNDIKHNSFKSDVFSLAFCLLYAAGLNIYVLYEMRKVYDTKSVLFILNKTFKGKLSNEFINLLGKMLDINEENRYDFIELEEVLKRFE